VALASLASGGLLPPARVAAAAAEQARFVRLESATGLAAPARTLSGGNQQKVVLGKWLATNPRILIMDEPTRGIDVGAKAEIHQLMRKLAGEGMAILMISSELPEVLGMSDRVLVMNGGRIIGEFDKDHATAEAVGTVMTRSMTREDAA
jgi:ABC-type sugar transport system ATPase subunit